ncbi:MAG: ABC transporter substrate-binding protein [Deltaproteobacteria bacterium]|nr:ABC transporter substrate-binding protein [Deltaproteobacteria bacterium]
MAKLKLTVACDKYDYLQPLRDGQVKAEGLDLNLITVESGMRHERMVHYGEYDACEFSMSSYLVARGQDADWLQAIPFFPRRMWGHKFCFIRAGSDIKKPSDLRGGRIGLRSYENTLALVTKGMLMNSYDLAVTDVTWVIVNKEHVGSRLPPSIKVEFIEGKRRLEDLLVEGKVDAEVEPDLPQAWIRGEGTVQGLFPDFEKAEREYYQRTKIFPIMHPVVIKKDILDRDPWVATSLFEAFVASRRAYNDFMEQPHRLSFAWARSYLEEERKFFGKDPFYQGFKENCHDVENLIKFADQQGMLGRPLTVEELFTENTRNT